MKPSAPKSPRSARRSRLERLAEAARNYVMTPREVAEQRVSFIWGQMGHKSGLSKDDIRAMLRARGYDL